MRALVTGATGFLGRYLIERLLARGDEVTALARDPAGASAALPPGVKIVACDITASAPAASALSGHDVLFHLACARKGTFASGRADADAFQAVNTAGTLTLARAWSESSGGRFVFVSSTAAMGKPERLPVTEDSPCRPTTPYGRSKHAAEEGLRVLVAQGLDAIVLRPCLILGAGKVEGEMRTMLRLVARGAFPLFRGFASARKPLVAASDVAAALLACADRRSRGDTYLITAGVDHPLEAIVQTAARLLGRSRGGVPLPYLPFAIAARIMGALGRLTGLRVPLTPERLELFVADRAYSIERARRDLGYTPRLTSLDELLGPVVDEFRAGRPA